MDRSYETDAAGKPLSDSGDYADASLGILERIGDENPQSKFLCRFSSEEPRNLNISQGEVVTEIRTPKTRHGDLLVLGAIRREYASEYALQQGIQLESFVSQLLDEQKWAQVTELLTALGTAPLCDRDLLKKNVIRAKNEAIRHGEFDVALELLCLLLRTTNKDDIGRQKWEQEQARISDLVRELSKKPHKIPEDLLTPEMQLIDAVLDSDTSAMTTLVTDGSISKARASLIIARVGGVLKRIESIEKDSSVSKRAMENQDFCPYFTNYTISGCIRRGYLKEKE
jgi:hypothetical protein